MVENLNISIPFKALESKFDGQILDTFTAIVHYAQDPARFFAHRIYDAITVRINFEKTKKLISFHILALISSEKQYT